MPASTCWPRTLSSPVATADTDGPRQRASIYTPDAAYTSAATLADDGSVDLAPTGAPAALDEMLAMFAKLTARGAAKRRDDGLPPWPARVLRWRP